jgi:D-alanyl-lipoteichoic acid acyltransferase DltB (MBOAT superfamily)
MTLSRWLRDYLYIALGGNRKGPTRTQVNLMLTMLLGGLWHGASWNFVIWGGIHGLWLAIERSLLFRIPGWHSDHVGMRVLRWFVTFHIVCFAWIFFRAPDLASSMLVLRKLGLLFDAQGNFAALQMLALSLATFLALHVAGARYALQRRIGEGPLWLHSSATLACLLMLILLTPQYSAPFIYFQF